MDKLDKLIEILLKEREEDIEIPRDYNNKYLLYKALVNIRLPKEISDDYLELEDEFLQERFKGKVVDVNNFSGAMFLYKGDITKLNCDVIVNPGNSKGIGCFEPTHYCLDNVINTNAGMRLRLACNKEMSKRNYNLEVSECIITEGYNLACCYVIETVGPIVYNELTDKDRQDLANCYNNALALAREKGLRSIAFPCISTGIFNFPNREAADIAYHTIKNYLDKYRDSFDKVIICTYKDIDYNYYKDLFAKEVDKI